MKRLFGEDDRWTDVGGKLDREVDRALDPIFKRWHAKGFSVREISHVAMSAVTMLECEMMLDVLIKNCKEE